MDRRLLARHRKLVVALVGAAVTCLSLYFGPDARWVQIVTTLATALGVYQAPNS